jgi:hypothetical protein
MHENCWTIQDGGERIRKSNKGLDWSKYNVFIGKTPRQKPLNNEQTMKDRNVKNGHVKGRALEGGGG